MTVLHLNIVSFYSAVAMALKPRLRDYPVAVALPGVRRPLIDVSAKAWEYGIDRGMPAKQALKRCPGLRVIDPLPDWCHKANRALVKACSQWTPRVEFAGNGHVYADLSGTMRLWGNTQRVCESLDHHMRHELRLLPAIGLSDNKLLSKVATRRIKPDGICEIMGPQAESTLAGCPIDMIPLLSSHVITRLQSLNLHTAGDVQRLPIVSLQDIFPQHAFGIYQAVRGIDQRPVKPYQDPHPHLSVDQIIPGGSNQLDTLHAYVAQLASQLSFLLSEQHRGAQRMVVSVSFVDGVQQKRQKSLKRPIDTARAIADVAEPLLNAAFNRRLRVRRITLRAETLVRPDHQLSLFDAPRREAKVHPALTGIQRRFGHGAVGYGRAVVHA